MKRTLTVGLTAAALAVVPLSSAVADGHGLPDIEVQPVAVPTADDSAQVVVVHGVPGLEVDVLADGEPVLESFSYRDIEVLELPAGAYDLGVAAAGSTDEILSLIADVDAGTSYTVAAFLDAEGNPTIDAFVNETDATGIQPFPLAAFPEVAIIAGGEAALDDVPNGVTARIDVPGGTTLEGVGVGVAGSTDLAIDLGEVTVPEDTLLLVYAVGPVPADDAADDASDEDTMADDAEDEMVAPSAEHSPGTAGLAATSLPVWTLVLMALGALALAVPTLAAVRIRR